MHGESLCVDDGECEGVGLCKEGLCPPYYKVQVDISKGVQNIKMAIQNLPFLFSVCIYSMKHRDGSKTPRRKNSAVSF